jgi:glycosyltransferase involved in cell wall biosynthesis
MKVLLSAYACEPGRGSEPEVGFQALLTAARHHAVWVLTRHNNLPALEAFLKGHPDAGKVTLIGIDGPRWQQRLKKRLGVVGVHWYYAVWQRLAGRRGRQLDAAIDFDLVHHVTFATFWTRTGVAAIGKPLLWGPVGGGVDPPWRLLGVLGWRGLVRDGTRLTLRRLIGGRNSRRTMAGVTLALAQNRETARRLGGSARVEVFPHGISAVPPYPGLTARTNEILVVGRLTPYKATVLAVDVIHRLARYRARLVVVGGGPEIGRVRARAARLGVSELVEFTGPLPRQQVFKRVGEATLLLHPALHDDSPLIVAEAMALGTPVVCLDRGGAAEICRHYPGGRFLVVSSAGRREKVVAALAAAAAAFLDDPGEVARQVTLPVPSFGDRILDAYQQVAGTGRAG